MMDSFNILAADYRPMVLTYVTAVLGDAEQAEDVTQETFMAAQASLDRFRAGEDFGAWLRGIARNKAREHCRAASRERLVVDSRILEGMEDVFQAFDSSSGHSGPWMARLETLRTCIQALNETLRSAVETAYFLGLPLQQAADRLEVSFEAMNKRLHRARSQIRVCVSSKHGGADG